MADDRYFTELVSGKREAGDALDRAMAQEASEEEDSFIDILDLQVEDAAEEDESLGAAMRQWRSVLDHMIHGASSYDSATGESTRVHGKDPIVDWAVPEEVTGVPTELTTSFIALARAKWQEGVDEYRDGDSSKPFQGEVLEEILEESLDIYAYSGEAERQELLTPEQVDRINVYALSIYEIIREAQNEKGLA